MIDYAKIIRENIKPNKPSDFMSCEYTDAEMSVFANCIEQLESKQKELLEAGWILTEQNEALEAALAATKADELVAAREDNARLREGFGKLLTDISGGRVGHCPWAIYSPQIAVERIDKLKQLLKENNDE